MLALLPSFQRCQLPNKNKGCHLHATLACRPSTLCQNVANRFKVHFGLRQPGGKTLTLCYLGQVIYTVGSQFTPMQYWDSQRTSAEHFGGGFNGITHRKCLIQRLMHGLQKGYYYHYFSNELRFAISNRNEGLLNLPI